MGGLKRRVVALEGLTAGKLSPEVKQWLGQPLTQQEQRELDERVGIDAGFDHIDFDSMSDDLRAWLLQPPYARMMNQ